MKLKVNFKFDSIVGLAKNNLSFVLLGFLIVVAILTSFVVYGEWQKIIVANGNSSTPGQIVRVNLDGHKQLEQKLNDNATFEPQIIPGADAFGPAPSK